MVVKYEVFYLRAFVYAGLGVEQGITYFNTRGFLTMPCAHQVVFVNSFSTDIRSISVAFGFQLSALARLLTCMGNPYLSLM